MKNDIASYIATVGRDARESSRIIGSASSASKSEALKQIAAAVDGARAAIRDENAKDMAAAEHNGIDQPLIDRLLLNDKGIDQMPIDDFPYHSKYPLSNFNSSVMLWKDATHIWHHYARNEHKYHIQYPHGDDTFLYHEGFTFFYTCFLVYK